MKSSEEEVAFEAVGGMMLVAEYLQRLNIIKIIDDIVEPLRSNHRRLSHGETCFVFLLFLLFRPRAIYKMMDWVEETTYLRVLFPTIIPEHFNDDRIADTLDALHKVGVSNIFSAQSIQMIREFKLNTDQVHVDLTNFSVSGDYKDNEALNVTYGHSKSGRDDLKQFALEAGVTEEGIPIIQTTLDGNTADVKRYIPMWMGVKNILGRSDCILIGDCKLTSHDNLLTICKGKGYYIGPLAMYQKLKEELKQLVIYQKTEHILLQEIKKSKTKTVFYEGFETESYLLDKETNQSYLQRKIFVLSSQLKETQVKSLEERIKKVSEKLEKITKALHTKRYNSREKIEEALEKLLKKYKLSKELLTFEITEKKEIARKKTTRGKSSVNSTYTETEITTYGLHTNWNESEIEHEKQMCGYFILSTNKPAKELSADKVLLAYKQEWKVEKIFERLKGKIQTLPIYLKLTRRIEALMYLLMTCAQVFTLIDLEAKRKLEEENRKLERLFPNGIKVSRPKAEFMLDALRNIGLVYTKNGDDFSVKITGIAELQSDILHITKVSQQYMDTSYIAHRLDIAEKMNKEELYKSIMTKFKQVTQNTT